MAAKTTATPSEVAAWMVQQFSGKRGLYHQRVVCKIRDEFGEEHLYVNDNGNLAISKAVLKEFRCLTGDTVVWNKAHRCWVKRMKPAKHVATASQLNQAAVAHS